MGKIFWAIFTYLVFNSAKSSTVRKAQFWGGVYLFLFYFYPMILGACLSPLHCVWNPNKIYTVKHYPGVVCDLEDPEYRFMVWTSIISSVIFPLQFYILVVNVSFRLCTQ